MIIFLGKKYKIVYLCFCFYFIFCINIFSEDTIPVENTSSQPIENALDQPIEDAASQDEILSSQKVTLDYKDAELSSVLRSLAYSYKLNLVTTKDMSGKVTITLRDVPVAQALDAILRINGYNYMLKDNLIYVLPGPGINSLNMQSFSFKLKYITVVEAKELLQKVLSEKGDIRTNESTNNIVITDFPESLDKVKILLKDIDVPPLQVLIEAKILDITSSDLENFGVTYSMEYKPIGDNTGLFKRNTAGTSEEIDTTTTLAGPSSTLSGGQLKLNAFAIKGFTASATIDALVRDDKAHLLASPSISTLNGKEARIIIGEKYPYKEKTQTTTGTTETTKFVDVGTTLRVTPQVSEDGWITMVIHPEVSSVSASLDAGPRITTREADATVRIADGDTLVIGGLISNKDDAKKGGIPILSDIPIIGVLFSNKSVDGEQKELTVFITPHIIRTKEEAAAYGTVSKDEVYLSLEQTATRNYVTKMLEIAGNLESKDSAVSKYKTKTQRMGEALDIYDEIVRKYPDARGADVALYRIGYIYYAEFKDYDLAKEKFNELLSLYPRSSYRKEAAAYLKKLEQRLKK